MLRGYHPLQEIYRWDRILVALWILYTTFVGLASSSAFSAFPQWDMVNFLFTPIGMVLVWLFFILWLKRGLNKTFRARSAVLHGEYRPVLPVGPAAIEVPLPFSLNTGISRVHRVVPGFLLLVPVGGVILAQLPLFLPDPYVIPAFFWPGQSWTMLFGVGGWMLIRTIVVDTYLLPTLELDENGITAVYGPDRVSMAWQQIRYIAQLDYKMPQSQWKERVQLYEICDGENTITWHANPRQKTRQPSSLSTEKYAQLLGDSVPALISQKTGLPLLDLREPKKVK